MLYLECGFCREDHNRSEKDKERAGSGLFYVQSKAKTKMFPIELSFGRVPFILGHKKSESHPTHGQTDKEADDFETEHAETLTVSMSTPEHLVERESGDNIPMR